MTNSEVVDMLRDIRSRVADTIYNLDDLIREIDNSIDMLDDDDPSR